MERASRQMVSTVPRVLRGAGKTHGEEVISVKYCKVKVNPRLTKRQRTAVHGSDQIIYSRSNVMGGGGTAVLCLLVSLGFTLLYL